MSISQEAHTKHLWLRQILGDHKHLKEIVEGLEGKGVELVVIMIEYVIKMLYNCCVIL